MLLFHPITATQLNRTLIAQLPLQPASYSRYGAAPMTGEEIRAAFDASTRLLCERLNAVIEQLSGEEGGVGALPLDSDLTLRQCLDTLQQGQATLTESVARIEAQLAALQGG